MVNILLSQYNFHEKWAKDSMEKYLNPHTKILIIPFSFGEQINNDVAWQNAYSKASGKYYKSIVLPFLSFGVNEENINWVNYFTNTKEHANNKLLNSDIIFFTGGYPDKMMRRLNEFDLINKIENYSGVIIGSSAGAMIQIKEYHITPDEDYSSFSYQLGLNLIKNFDIEVHYEASNLQTKFINKVLNEKRVPVYAIKDTGGIIIDNNIIELIGDVMTFKMN